jgi:FAD/FMN-containing dehydrogenase
MGMMTPAVSHVGAVAAGGASGKMQRKHGVMLGLIVIVTPYDPTAAP